MRAHVSSILLGVQDMDRAKQFYTEGLGWKIQSDFGISVFFESDGASPVGFYRRSVFVIDREGVVRWAHRATAGLTFRPVDEIVDVVRALDT